MIIATEKLHKKPKVRAEVIRWTGYQGEEVTGILYYPENYEEGKRYPLMLSIHGGPTGYDQDQWSERWSTSIRSGGSTIGCTVKSPVGSNSMWLKPPKAAATWSW